MGDESGLQLALRENVLGLPVSETGIEVVTQLEDPGPEDIRRALTAVQATRAKADALLGAMQQMLAGAMLPEAQCPLTHYFAGNTCAREVLVPAGSVVIGAIHKLPNINILLQGSASVLMEDGTVARVQAPFVGVFPMGTRRVAFVHEDVRFLNVFSTDLRDGDAIRERYTVDTADEFEAYCAQQLALENKT